MAATDDRVLNRTVAQLCRKRSIPVNVADSREDSTFLFPAVVRRGRLSVGISTGGASPAAAAYVRRTLEGQLPASLEPILDWMAEVRETVKGALPQPEHRAAFARLFIPYNRILFHYTTMGAVCNTPVGKSCSCQPVRQGRKILPQSLKKRRKPGADPEPSPPVRF